MKTKITILLLMLAIVANSQVTKEKYLAGISVKPAVINGENMYFTFNDQSQIFILKSDYSTYKQVKYNITVPSDISVYYVVNMGGFCKNLYSDKIGFWVIFKMLKKLGGYSYCGYVFDEDANTIAKIDSSIEINIFGVKNKVKLISKNFLNDNISVYSLPYSGKIDTIKLVDTVYQYKTVMRYDTTYQSKNTIIEDNNPNTIVMQNSNVLLSAFPNPATDKIIIPYDNGDKLTIYKSNGVALKSYPLLKTSNAIVINVVTLVSGSYIYKIESNGVVTYTGKFNKI